MLRLVYLLILFFFVYECCNKVRCPVSTSLPDCAMTECLLFLTMNGVRINAKLFHKVPLFWLCIVSHGR
jgi:hypothetical protein